MGEVKDDGSRDQGRTQPGGSRKDEGEPSDRSTLTHYSLTLRLRGRSSFAPHIPLSSITALTSVCNAKDKSTQRKQSKEQDPTVTALSLSTVHHRRPQPSTPVAAASFPSPPVTFPCSTPRPILRCVPAPLEPPQLLVLQQSPARQQHPRSPAIPRPSLLTPNSSLLSQPATPVLPRTQANTASPHRPHRRILSNSSLRNGTWEFSAAAAALDRFR